MEQGEGGENTVAVFAAMANPSQQTLAFAAYTDPAHQMVLM